MIDSFHERIQEIEHLADRLNHTLAYHGSNLEQDGLYDQAQGLAMWVRCYRHGLRYGLLAADRMSAPHGDAWHMGVSDRLKLEALELHSLDERDAAIDIDASEPQPEKENFIDNVRSILRAAGTATQETILVPSVSLPSMLAVQSRPNQKEAKMFHTHTLVKDLMQRNPVIIPPDYTLKEAAQEMDVVNCGILPVGTPDRIEGIITDRDIVLRAVAKGKDINQAIVKDYMTPDVCSVYEEDDAAHAADIMREKNVNRLLVKDKGGRPRGILSFGRMMRDNDSMQELTAVIESAYGHKAA